jgi:hypothetical protein
VIGQFIFLDDHGVTLMGHEAILVVAITRGNRLCAVGHKDVYIGPGLVYSA